MLNNRNIERIIIVLMLLFIAGCSSRSSNNSHSITVAGLTWIEPSSWEAGQSQPMRVKTYIIKPVDGDSDNAECGVFYFGRGMGGNRESNLQRWENQFEQADGRNSYDLAEIKELEVSGLKITTIELGGIYMMATGPMMEVKEKKQGYRLLGAIIEGPQGLVFFKLTGPEKTIKYCENDFMIMLQSIKPSAL
jgi:hypothetical protein